MSVPTCRRCPAELLWAKMPSGKRNPLDVDRVEPEVGKGVIAYDPQTKRGTPITKDNVDQVARWLEEGRTFHVSHFATCPERQRFRRRPS